VLEVGVDETAAGYSGFFTFPMVLSAELARFRDAL
jgi:hypothetical protein